MSERIVTLSKVGLFTANHGATTAHVYCDSAHPDGRWIVSVGGGHGSAASPVSWHEDLDEALRDLAATAGFDGPFSVRLPCAETFLRPGRVAAISILAGLGYYFARGVTTWVMMETPADHDADMVRELLVQRLAGRSVCVGDVSLVESEDGVAAWCCDVELPFEGPLSTKLACDLVSREFEGSGLDLADSVEIVPFTLVDPHQSTVIEMRPLIAAPKAA